MDPLYMYRMSAVWKFTDLRKWQKHIVFSFCSINFVGMYSLLVQLWIRRHYLFLYCQYMQLHCVCIYIIMHESVGMSRRNRFLLFQYSALLIFMNIIHFFLMLILSPHWESWRPDASHWEIYFQFQFKGRTKKVASIFWFWIRR